MKAENVKVRQTKNWISTPLPFPRITDGMAEDKRKTHAKAWIKTSMSILETSQAPIEGQNKLMESVTVMTAV